MRFVTAFVIACAVVFSTQRAAVMAAWSCFSCVQGGSRCLQLNADPMIVNALAMTPEWNNISVVFNSYVANVMNISSVAWDVEDVSVNYRLQRKLTAVCPAPLTILNLTQLDNTTGRCAFYGQFPNTSMLAHVVFQIQDDWSISADGEILGDLPSTVQTPFVSLSSQTPPIGGPIVGGGEVYNHFDLRGQVVPVFTREQGIGRGLEPLTTEMNLFGYSGGDEWTSYAARPVLLSPSGWAFVSTTSTYSELDLSVDGWLSMRANGTLRVSTRFWAATDLAGAIAVVTNFVGRPKAPPSWSYQGAIIGMQGGTSAVLGNYSALAALGCPMSAFWLQDWTGSREWIPGWNGWTGLWWNWEWNADHYPNHTAMVAELKGQGIRTLTYLNPMLADAASEHAPNVTNYYAEALSKDYLVRHGPSDEVWTGYVGAHLVDLANPAAFAWYKTVVKSAFQDGVAGMMADFGEGYPLDANMSYANASMRELGAAGFHNVFPDEWFRLVREAVEELGVSDDVFFFGRSAWLRSASYYSAGWQGDQLCNWDSFDGLGSAVTSLLSSGVSGTPFMHSDIGGYNAVLGYARTEELFLRWAELAAFTSFFRTHDGSSPLVNWQFYRSASTMKKFARYAKLYAALVSVREGLVAEAVRTGLPVARPLLLHYPGDVNTFNLTKQFMLGRDVLVAPVTAPNATSVQLYFPAGCWQSIWAVAEYEPTYNNPAAGQFQSVGAPLGCPAAFIACNTTTLLAIRTSLSRGGVTCDLQRGEI